MQELKQTINDLGMCFAKQASVLALSQVLCLLEKAVLSLFSTQYGTRT